MNTCNSKPIEKEISMDNYRNLLLFIYFSPNDIYEDKKRFHPCLIHP